VGNYAGPRQEVATSISMLQAAVDLSSPSARNVLEAAAQGDAIASEAEEKFRVMKQEMLKHIKGRRCL